MTTTTSPGLTIAEATQIVGSAPTTMSTALPTRLARAMTSPAPSRFFARPTTMVPRMPPTAPLSMNTPNHASGTPSRSSTNSTQAASAAEKHSPTNVLRNHKVRSIGLAMMNRYPSTSWRNQCTAGVSAGPLRYAPAALAGSRKASTPATAKTATLTPSGITTATANNEDVNGPDTRFCMTSSPASIREFAALDAAGADLSRVVMVGDRAHDRAGAVAHGLPCVLVTWGYGTAEEHNETDAVVDTPAQLAALLGVMLPVAGGRS